MATTRILVLGQSNAANHLERVDSLRYPGKCDTSEASSGLTYQGNLWVGLTNRLQAAGKDVFIKSIAVGSTHVADWLDPGFSIEHNGKSFYPRRTLEATLTAGEYQYIIFQHGESDVISRTSTSNYFNALQNIFRLVKEKAAATQVLLAHGGYWLIPVQDRLYPNDKGFNVMKSQEMLTVSPEFKGNIKIAFSQPLYLDESHLIQGDGHINAKGQDLLINKWFAFFMGIL
ncbi:hypothetical protein [Thiothrix nivea]|uniref:Sialate O-acetylesterase domain-containing protein n=1 Tax=Thiothrix nivea (strain ATCC 35100 / DSM 5205 / JP2) TaxID=870187 RepID=A0A656HL48_THINJ|nr:hypothetical protein [Thiothrix nivea]EIJ36236.1 hypothetical protein Thini_3733 [Thiothrix nivea DSM 5205]